MSTPEWMTDEDYLQAQEHLLLLAGMIQLLDLEGFLDRIERADNVGWFRDPTLWRDAHDDLYALRDLAMAALSFKKTAAELKAKELPSAPTQRQT